MDNALIKARLHPLQSAAVSDTARQGESIQEIIDRLGAKNNVNQWYCQKVYVEVNGKPLLPSAYNHTYVKADDLVVIQFCIPEGGDGKNPLKTILLLVVAVVAIWITGGGASALFGGYGAYAGAAFAIIGGYAVNALIPPEPLSSNNNLSGDDREKTDIYSITGMRNYLPHYKPLPLVLGRVRYAPPYGALPYTRFSGNDQYLYCYVVWGHGELAIEELRLGETLLSQYNDVLVESTAGLATDPELNLVPSDVYPESIGADVKYGIPIVRTTQLNTQLISLQLVFNRGLFGIDEETGERVAASVAFRVSHRLNGDTQWIVAGAQEVVDTAAYPKRVAFEFTPVVYPDENGQYDVMVERLSAETDDKTYDTFQWTEIQSVTYQDPVSFPIPVAKTQLRIKATEQLSGIVDNLNAWVSCVCLDYEYTTGTWIKRATSNPASLYRHVYTAPCTARPLSVNQLDIDALEEWHDFCRIKGFSYNRVHDTRESIQSIISKICHAGQAMFVMRDDIRSVQIDRARSLGPVQLFTPANSKKLSSKKTFSQELHGYRVAFNNEVSDNKEDEVIVYTQGYTQANSHIFEALQFPGVTTVGECIEHTKYHLATRRYRSELFTWESDWEHLNCSRGDLVAVAADCILISQVSGRIKSHDVLTKTIVLDQAITVQEQTDYNLVIRTTPDGTEYSNVFTQGVSAQFPDWTTDTLTYTGELPHTTRRGDVYSFGEAGLETMLVVITSKRPKKDMSAVLTGVQYSWPEIEAFMAGEFPALNSGITTPVFTSNLTPPPPTITYVATGASSAVTNPDGSTMNRITLVLTIPSGWAVSVSSVQVDILTAEGWQRSSHSNPNEPVVFDNVAPGDHQVRARTVSSDGRVSAWVYKTITQVDGTPRPGSVLSLTVEGNLFQNDISWVLPVDFRDNYRIAIYCSPGLNDRSNIGPPVAVLNGGTKWSHTGLIPEVQYFYWARIYGIGVGSRETTLDITEGWHDDEGSWQDGWGQWDGVPTTSIGGWSDEDGEWYDEAGNAWGGIDPYADPKFSEWYPLNRFGGVQASPITDNARILDMLTESIGRGQLVGEINTAIDGAVAGVNYQQQFLENAWTVKIQEIGGRPYMVGVGLVLYPDHAIGVDYVVDQYVWMDSEDNVYKCKVDHTSSLSNQPPIQTYWELIPYGKKSGVAIVADQFSVTTPDGTGEVTPFVISGSIVGINGTLIVNGTVRATALSATDIYTVTIQSANYAAATSGWKIDSLSGLAELNNVDIITRNTETQSYGHLTGGDLKYYQYFNGAYQMVKSLKRIEVGVCTNGVSKTLSGYWATQPQVIVTPNSIQTYNPAYANQAQTLICAPGVVTALGNGRYSFLSSSMLQIAAGVGGTAINAGSASASITSGIVSDTGWPTDNYGQSLPYMQYQLAGVTNVSSAVVYFTGNALVEKILYIDGVEEQRIIGWATVNVFYEFYDNSGWHARVYQGWANREGAFSGVFTVFGTNISYIRVGIYLNYAPGYYEFLASTFGGNGRTSKTTIYGSVTPTSFSSNMAGATIIAGGTNNFMAIST